jgi:hypothetical protein
MGGNKGIVAAVLVILLLGVGYFVYNRQLTSRTPTPAVDLIASANPSPVEEATQSTESAGGGEEMVITLSAQNNSGESGIAILKDVNGKTLVSLKINGAPPTAQPAHIHMGECPSPGAVKYPLTNVVSGLSETTLDVSVAELKSELPLAINVHKSPQDLPTYVACGDLE